MSCDNTITDYSPELPEMGDEEEKEKLNLRSIEDGEIFDTPLKDNKVWRNDLIHFVTRDSDICLNCKLRWNEKGSEDGRIQRRICERMKTMVNRREVRWWYRDNSPFHRVQTLEKEMELRKGFIIELNESKEKVAQLGRLLDVRYLTRWYGQSDTWNYYRIKWRRLAQQKHGLRRWRNRLQVR